MLTPKAIESDLKNSDLDKQSAVELLITLIENVDNVNTRIESIEVLEKLDIKDKKIYNVLQLRVQPAIIALKEKVKQTSKTEKHDIVLTYITSRGNWYFVSWKGDLARSGGIATNIGIHFFDMLIWIFGAVKRNEVHHADEKKTSGFLELEKANVRWFLSVDRDDLPEAVKAEAKPTFRSITVDEEEIEFSGGFEDLHTVVYRHTLDGQGFGIDEARPSINLTHEIRNAKPTRTSSNYLHPFTTNLR